MVTTFRRVTGAFPILGPRPGREADAYTCAVPVLVKGQPPRVVRATGLCDAVGRVAASAYRQARARARVATPTHTRSRSCRSVRGRCLAAAVEVTGEMMH